MYNVLFSYQEIAHKSALHPDVITLNYCTKSLVGEVGELFNLDKKAERGDFDRMDKRDEYLSELGDCLWYIAEIATLLGITLDYEFGDDSYRDGSYDVGSLEYCMERMLVQSHDLFTDRDELPMIGHLDDEIIEDIDAIAQWFNSSLSEVAQMNLDKLAARVENGTIKGSGHGEARV